MALPNGIRLGPYEILGPLGAGGMGEVYRAHDTRLDRSVAIKVLAPRLTEEPRFRKRFEREARVIAGLEHPHICALFDIGDEQGINFLVMPYLQGETVADLLRHGPLPMDRAVRYGIEIAWALDAAHRAGVVHRDLKPSNVMVTKSGVKLLDFGLARVEAEEVASGPPNDATITASLTESGIVLGTIPYMAPEQIEGKVADARTDIFALGALLYEMTTGRRPFSGDSQASLLAAIMRVDPPVMAGARQGVPPALDRVVRKCLAKDPDARWQDAGDLATELQWVLEQTEAVSASPARASRSARVWPLTVALATLAAAAAWTLKPVPPLPPGPTAHLTIDLPPGAQLGPFGRPALAISPDGRRLVYAARLNGTFPLFIRTLAQPESKVLTETDGFPTPFFSPDGEWVGFRSDGALKKIPIVGGAPVTIATEEGGAGASWGVDDRIVFAGTYRAPLSRVAASGGQVQPLTTLDLSRVESSHRFPELLPGGRAVVFTAGPPPDGPWYDAEISAYLFATGQRRTLIRGAAQAHYLAPGYLVYARAGTLYAVPFDTAALQVTGPPVAVLEGVREDPAQSAAQFTVSENGTLVYVSGGLISTEVVRVDRQGRATSLLPQEHRLFDQPRLSPDGRQLALNVGGGDDATFVYDLAEQRLSRVTSGANHLSPTWMPDSKRLTTVRSDGPEIVSTYVDRSEPEEVLYRAPDGGASPTSWTPDGRELVFMRNNHIWTLTLPERRAAPLVESRFVEDSPSVSPDGRWLAYGSNESGSREVYVQAFRGAGQRWRVSRAGGTEPVWARNSQHLYFRQGQKLLAVTAQPPFSNPVELFDAPWALGGGGVRPQYDVTPDDEFLMIRMGDPALARIHVVLNWVEEVKGRVPR